MNKGWSLHVMTADGTQHVFNEVTMASMGRDGALEITTDDRMIVFNPSVWLHYSWSENGVREPAAA